MHRLLLVMPILLGLAGCSGFSGNSTSQDSSSTVPPKNLSGYVQKGVMKNATIRIIGINSLGQMDKDDQGVVAGPISYTGEDGSYISAINGEFSGQLVAMVRPRFKEVTCAKDEGCKDIYGKLFEKDSTVWPDPDGEVLTTIVCDSYDGCLTPSGEVGFGVSYRPGKDFMMMAAVADFQDGQVINVTPLTHMAVELANSVFQDGGSSSQGILTSRTIMQANSLVANLFFEPQTTVGQVEGSDVDITALRPADLRNVTGTLTSGSEVNAIHYALVNAAIERLAKENNPSAPALETPVIAYLNNLIAEYKSSRGLSAGDASDYAVSKILSAIKDEMDDLLDPSQTQFISSAFTADLKQVVEANLTSIEGFSAADKVLGTATPAPSNVDEGVNDKITLANAKLYVDKVLPWMGQITLDFDGFNLSKFKLGCGFDDPSCIEWPELISGEFAGASLAGFTSTEYLDAFNEHVNKGKAFDTRARPELEQLLDKINSLWILAVACAHGSDSDLTCSNDDFLANYSASINGQVNAYKANLGSGLVVTKGPVSAGSANTMTTLTFNDVAIDNTQLNLTVKIADVSGAAGSIFEVIYEGQLWYGDLQLDFPRIDSADDAQDKLSKVTLNYVDQSALNITTEEPQVIDYTLKRFKATLIETGAVGSTATDALVLDTSVYLEAEVNQRLVAVKSFLEASSQPRYNVSSGSLIGKFVELDENAQQEDIFSLSVDYAASNVLFYYPDYAGNEDKFPPLFNFLTAPDGQDLADQWVDPDTSENRPLLELSFVDVNRAAVGDSKWISSANLTVPGVTDQYRLYQSLRAGENHRLQTCRQNDDQVSFTCGAEGPLSDEMEVAIGAEVQNGAGQTLTSGSADVDKLQKLMDFLRASDTTNSLLNKTVVTGFGLYKIGFPEDFLFWRMQLVKISHLPTVEPWKKF